MVKGERDLLLCSNVITKLEPFIFPPKWALLYSCKQLFSLKFFVIGWGQMGGSTMFVVFSTFLYYNLIHYFWHLQETSLQYNIIYFTSWSEDRSKNGVYDGFAASHMIFLSWYQMFTLLWYKLIPPSGPVNNYRIFYTHQWECKERA